MDEETLNIVFTTLSLTGFSMLIILAIGLPLGFVLGYFDFRGKHILRTVVDTLLALPTVVVGLLVYAFISRRGPLGNFELLFTIRGMAIGQVILGLPIMTMEFAVGRASRKSPVRAYQALEKPGQKWHIHGYFTLIGCYLLMMFYTTVAGWMLHYFYMTAVGKLAGLNAEQVAGKFTEMLASPATMTFWMVFVVVVSILVCVRVCKAVWSA